MSPLSSNLAQILIWKIIGIASYLTNLELCLKLSAVIDERHSDQDDSRSIFLKTDFTVKSAITQREGESLLYQVSSVSVT